MICTGFPEDVMRTHIARPLDMIAKVRACELNVPFIQAISFYFYYGYVISVNDLNCLRLKMEIPTWHATKTMFLVEE